MLRKKYKSQQRYSDDEYVNMLLHQMERFVKVDKLSDTELVLLWELLHSIYRQWFKDGELTAD